MLLKEQNLPVLIALGEGSRTLFDFLNLHVKNPVGTKPLIFHLGGIAPPCHPQLRACNLACLLD